MITTASPPLSASTRAIIEHGQGPDAIKKLIEYAQSIIELMKIESDFFFSFGDSLKIHIAASLIIESIRTNNTVYMFLGNDFINLGLLKDSILGALNEKYELRRPRDNSIIISAQEDVLTTEDILVIQSVRQQFGEQAMRVFQMPAITTEQKTVLQGASLVFSGTSFIKLQENASIGCANGPNKLQSFMGDPAIRAAIAENKPYPLAA